MSAEILRRAASLVRERARKAQQSGDGEPWYPADEMHSLIGGGSRNTADAEHIASWHPAVALAVADWLDAEASNRDAGIGGRGWFSVGGQTDALAVARAYLGESA